MITATDSERLRSTIIGAKGPRVEDPDRCPACGSEAYYPETAGVSVTGWVLYSVCHDCGYYRERPI